MKTLMIITGGLGTGGLERISCFVANTFREKDWRVVVLALFQQKGEKERSFQILDKDVIVVEFDGKRDPVQHKYSAIKTWRKMIRKATKEYKPDSILAMTFKVGSMVCLFAPKYAKKVTIREISDPKSKSRKQWVNNMTEFFTRKVKNIIFQTRWEKSCYHKKIQDKGVVIPNPLSIKVTDHGTFSAKKMFTLSRLSNYQKRLDVLIEGFALFHQKHPEYVLEIYGRGDDKELFKELIAKSSCPDAIMLCDPVPTIHQKVLDYRCFVQTSDFEGMSNALLECYCLGIPCVSSNWPGVEDIIADGKDGLLYPRQDAEALAKQLARIAEDDELCKRLTQNAIASADRFNEKDVIQRYCEVIERE